MQKLCKDKQNYEPRQQPASKNSMATLSHILLHKASLRSIPIPSLAQPARQSLSKLPVPIPISMPIPSPLPSPPACSILTSLWAVNGNCFSENGQLFLATFPSCLLPPASYLVQVNCAAKCKNQLFYKFSNTGNSSSPSPPSPSSSSAPRERNGHLNSNRKTFGHIEVTLKCALNLISVRRLSRAPAPDPLSI